MRAILISIILCIIVTVGGTIIVSNKHKKDIKAKTEVQDDFLKIPDYGTETPKSNTSTTKPASNITTTTTTTYGDDASYWFIVVQRNNGTMMNTLIKQDHNWFSFSETKASFKDKVFILNIVKVDKETYENNQ
jgi:uncharacterized protein YxeA